MRSLHTETKVQRLVEGIKIPTNTVMGMTVNHGGVENNLTGDWNGAVSYLSGKMAKVFPEKNRNKLHKARRASEVNSGRGRGGHGRGRDGGRGNGQQRGMYDARNSKMFYNWVDVSDPTRTFSGSEKMKLDRDREAWNYIRNRMLGGRYYEGPDSFFDENSKTGLGFEIGQPQQKCQRRPTLQSMANSAVCPNGFEPQK